MKIVIDIDGKAVAKGRGRAAVVNGHAHIFTPAHTRSYESHIKFLAQQAMAGRAPLEGAVEVRVDVFLDYPKSMPLKRRTGHPCKKPDIDNYVKAALDGINTIVLKDDCQVVRLIASKVYRDKPAMRIEVNELMTLGDLL